MMDSPLLVAVRVQDHHAVRFLLDRGHKPDAFPLPSPEALDLLLPHANVSLRTPMFGCHLLQFAVAMLARVVVKRVLEAMGGGILQGPAGCPCPRRPWVNTLLLISSLSIDDTVANLQADAVCWSAHEFRTTSATWALLTFLPSTKDDVFTMHDIHKIRPWPLRPGIRGGHDGRLHTRRSKPAASRDVLLWIGLVLLASLEDADVHGTTAPHYLVSVLNLGEQLLGTLKQRVQWQGTGETWTPVWAGSQNLFGFSPRDLSRAG
ncbi:hypothetical protein VTK73DRAFT_10029 [Phialemonium thermophilum]|uniref:Uncharacterized protein n=1 Tax=Phialemonium thermophilum TaxID=223376 RepID=A0ABR3XIP7_9PEZI